MKNGDIYFWRWKATEGVRMPYHCKSQKAIARNGVLYDTFWSDHNHPIPLDKVDLVFKGNINLLDEIKEWETPYYCTEDIVDMRHSNTSMAKVYVRAGAKRDPQMMKEFAEYQVERSQSEIRSCEHRIDLLNAAIASIDAGELDNIHIPVMR